MSIATVFNISIVPGYTDKGTIGWKVKASIHNGYSSDDSSILGEINNRYFVNEIYSAVYHVIDIIENELKISYSSTLSIFLEKVRGISITKKDIKDYDKFIKSFCQTHYYTVSELDTNFKNYNYALKKSYPIVLN